MNQHHSVYAQDIHPQQRYALQKEQANTPQNKALPNAEGIHPTWEILVDESDSGEDELEILPLRSVAIAKCPRKRGGKTFPGAVNSSPAKESRPTSPRSESPLFLRSDSSSPGPDSLASEQQVNSGGSLTLRGHDGTVIFNAPSPRSKTGPPGTKGPALAEKRAKASRKRSTQAFDASAPTATPAVTVEKRIEDTEATALKSNLRFLSRIIDGHETARQARPNGDIVPHFVHEGKPAIERYIDRVEEYFGPEGLKKASEMKPRKRLEHAREGSDTSTASRSTSIPTSDVSSTAGLKRKAGEVFSARPSTDIDAVREEATALIQTLIKGKTVMSKARLRRLKECLSACEIHYADKSTKNGSTTLKDFQRSVNQLASLQRDEIPHNDDEGLVRRAKRIMKYL